jgi:hypothetical protein
LTAEAEYDQRFRAGWLRFGDAFRADADDDLAVKERREPTSAAARAPVGQDGIAPAPPLRRGLAHSDVVASVEPQTSSPDATIGQRALSTRVGGPGLRFLRLEVGAVDELG